MQLGARSRSAYRAQWSDDRTSGRRGHSGRHSKRITQCATRLPRIWRPRDHANAMLDCRVHGTVDRMTVHGIVPRCPHDRDTSVRSMGGLRAADDMMTTAWTLPVDDRVPNVDCSRFMRAGPEASYLDGRRDDRGWTGPRHPAHSLEQYGIIQCCRPMSNAVLARDAPVALKFAPSGGRVEAPGEVLTRNSAL